MIQKIEKFKITCGECLVTATFEVEHGDYRHELPRGWRIYRREDDLYGQCPECRENDEEAL